MYFNLHTHQNSNSGEIVALVNQYPQEFDETVPFFSIGIHPWYIVEKRVAEDLAFIENKLQLQNCLAVGECGLDKRIEIPFDLQMKVFEQQLMLAEQHRKPVVVHCVAAFSELIEIKNRLKISVPVIIHGFSKNGQLAKQLLYHGFYLSFGKYLMKNPELETVFKNIPDDQFFLETDTTTEKIQDVYSLAAKYKNIDLEILKSKIAQNFNTVFQLKNRCAKSKITNHNGRMD